MTMPGLCDRQRLQHDAQRLGAAGGGADADHPLGGACHRLTGVGGGSITSALSLRGGSAVTGARRRQALQPRLRRGLHRLADAHLGFHQELRGAETRLEDHVDGAGLERLHQRLGALLGQRGAHHHGDRPLRHQLAQEGDAVHARHLDIQRDHVGHFGLDAPRGDERIGRGADHRDVRIAAEHLGQRLAHDRRVVDDQHLHRRPHGARRNTVLATERSGRSMPASDSEWPRNRKPPGRRCWQSRCSTACWVGLSK